MEKTNYDLMDSLWNDRVGAMGWETKVKTVHATIIEILDEYNILLKEDELVVRYATLTSVVNVKNPIYPIVKINIKKKLIYFLDNNKFETKGIKLDYLTWL